MKSYFKRGLALVLAVALVVSSGLYVSSDRTLKAKGEDEMYSEDGAETTQEEVEGQAGQGEEQAHGHADAQDHRQGGDKGHGPLAAQPPLQPGPEFAGLLLRIPFLRTDHL